MSLDAFQAVLTAAGNQHVYDGATGSDLDVGRTSDCDCGHCGYREGGTCRYEGEGPYGCYRGCS